MKYLLIILLALLVCISISLLASLLIKKYSKLKKKRYLVIFTSVFSFILLLATMFTYLSIYNHADKSVKNYLVSSEEVKVEKTSFGYYFDGSGSKEAIIFYPGAKVEYTSYAPLMYELANSGIDCFLVKMPFNMAVFGNNKANTILKNYNYESYYMMGHSLGGVVASSYANSNDKIKGVILLASYSTKSITNKEVLSIYGSNDGVMNKKEYEQNKSNLPTNYSELVIDGANHSQFGMYGLQKGDNKATIDCLEQIYITVNRIKEILNSNILS